MESDNYYLLKGFGAVAADDDALVAFLVAHGGDVRYGLTDRDNGNRGFDTFICVKLAGEFFYFFKGGPYNPMSLHSDYHW